MKQTAYRAMVCAAAVVLALAAAAFAAEHEGWMTDFDAAKAKAAKEGKDLLVDFSGSDWCRWCVRLDEEVFSHKEFREKAAKEFILVLLDFPRKPENKEKIPEALRKRNDELKEELGIAGFPTVLLMDSKGTPYAKTGYQEGGPKKYLEDLAEFRSKKARKDKLVAELKASQATGLERARLLDGIVQAAQEELALKYHKKEIKEIIALDKDGKGGLREKYELRLRLGEAENAMDARDFKKAAGLYQAILDDLKPSGQVLQDVLFSKGAAHFYQEDKPGAKKCLEDALKAAPQGEKAKMIEANLKRLFPDEKKKED